MVAGLEITSPNMVITNRREAIKYAVSIAQNGDSILLLGKGHEVGQEINGEITPFNDVAELTEAIKQVLAK
jgi:UDP-N-acetylmuramoyl-L-alanyl-D-glutamate--2,6-diaminopimelate ligase